MSMPIYRHDLVPNRISTGPQSQYLPNTTDRNHWGRTCVAHPLITPQFATDRKQFTDPTSKFPEQGGKFLKRREKLSMEKGQILCEFSDRDFYTGSVTCFSLSLSSAKI